MVVRADGSRMKRKLKNLIEAVKDVETVDMSDAAFDIVDAIAAELAAVEHTQVGFNENLFITNLRASVRRDATGAWTVDPWEAGGDENDFEQIAGRASVQLGERNSKSLWHMGKGRTDAFFRLIYSNAQARNDLARARQEVWGDKTPQWYLINEGSPIAGQPATHFIDKALSTVPLTRLYTRIKARLQAGFR